MQLFLLNVLPHNVVQALFVKRMQRWRIRKVKTYEHAIFLSHSVLVLATWVIGLWVFHADRLNEALAEPSFVFHLMIVGVYVYLVHWALAGVCICVIAVF